MASAVERFRQEASRLGLSPKILEFPEGTRTAAEAAQAVGCHIGQIVKSLVFMAGEEAVLALTSGQNRVDPQALARLMGVSSVRIATPEEVREATGFAIGGTPPFGHSRPLQVFVDRDLLAHDLVWAAAGTPKVVFSLSPQELLAASGGTPAEIREG
ncbi:MAG TPA: YbaK/EbsC family protein [Actinomycetota bacterium]|jgi:prolyl-tRNA editing enzyme YbaK/EbsC (Cys-tRNA(Pro) deacylase)|nr:YbaK/EbsC family protein [Actinomycetota bacterium]